MRYRHGDDEAALRPRNGLMSDVSGKGLWDASLRCGPRDRSGLELCRLERIDKASGVGPGPGPIVTSLSLSLVAMAHLEVMTRGVCIGVVSTRGNVKATRS